MRDVYKPGVPCAGSKYHSVDHAGVCHICGVALTGVVFESKPPYPLGTRLRGEIVALERFSTGWSVAIAGEDGQGYILMQGARPSENVRDWVVIELAASENDKHPWFWRIVTIEAGK